MFNFDGIWEFYKNVRFSGAALNQFTWSFISNNVSTTRHRVVGDTALTTSLENDIPFRVDWLVISSNQMENYPVSPGH